MAVFRQSLYDFPCPVVLGKKAPSFGLHRYKQGLRFIPPDDEGFTLRGDRRQLLYKGRRRSHRFTILGDTSFEYDVILKREPESNVISLRMEGAENYDFFRQPDFVKNPFLKGSYAVYKRETLIGEGTGKLCHIHRPEIIDARGRRCWGDLAVVGNELLITIPENWLSEAKYPVIVDPTVGTTTVGSQPNPVNIWTESSFLVYEIGVNKFLAPENIQGQCIAWAYMSFIGYENNHCYYPRLYADITNKPVTRLSSNEGLAFWGLYDDQYGNPLPTDNTPAWKSTTFNVIGTINQGSYIWFGGYGSIFYPRFDYGAVLYKTYIEYVSGGKEYQNFPYYGYEATYDRKVSWYFTFTTSSQNYVRTLTQGVRLTDTRKLVGNYKRTETDTAGIFSTLGRIQNLIRECVMSVQNTIIISRLPIFLRKVTELISVTMNKTEEISYSRKCNDNVQVISVISRIYTIIRKIQEAFQVFDTHTFSVLFLRSVHENALATDIFSYWWSFIRELLSTVGSNAETVHKAEYKRINYDDVQAEGNVLRSLFLKIRILTQVIIRDYLLRRFLIAKEELKLKSAICREITLDSRID